MRRPRQPSTLLEKLLIAGLVLYGLVVSWPYVQPGVHGAENWRLLWSAGALFFVMALAVMLTDVLGMIQKALRTFRALSPKPSAASASWLTVPQAIKAGLGGSKGMLLGLLEGQPISIENAIHGLLCAPARKGKTTSFIMNALCRNLGMSRVVADMKGELAAQTAWLIRWVQWQKVIIVNPAGKFGLENACYNPLIILLDDLEAHPRDVMADAASLAKQLIPVPPGGERDPYWPNGTRKLLVLLIVGLCALRKSSEATLTNAFTILSDNEAFEKLIIEARLSEVLEGELASFAASVAATWEEQPKHFESFREGALQVLAPFGPSGHLAHAMARCDFRFADLKKTRITLFLICDYSRMDVFAPWVRLMIWAAFRELIRSDSARPVRFLLDEFTNCRLPGLPEALTALGGYGVRCWMVVQELEEIVRVYGKESLATILSQTDVKQFFGVASQETARLVSQMLGEEELPAESFGMGQGLGETPNLSLGRMRRPLLTPDQVRRLPEDEQILFIQNLPPARALKVGYHEISPWRYLVSNNPLHGGKRYLGKVKLRLGWDTAKATKAGTRKIARTKRPVIRPALTALASITAVKPLILVGAAALVIQTYGWPHLLWEYDRRGTWCRYLGIPGISEGIVTRGGDHCPLIHWSKGGSAQ